MSPIQDMTYANDTFTNRRCTQPTITNMDMGGGLEAHLSTDIRSNFRQMLPRVGLDHSWFHPGTQGNVLVDGTKTK